MRSISKAAMGNCKEVSMLDDNEDVKRRTGVLLTRKWMSPRALRFAVRGCGEATP
jgi:hypothetical protein